MIAWQVIAGVLAALVTLLVIALVITARRLTEAEAELDEAADWGREHPEQRGGYTPRPLGRDPIPPPKEP